MPVWVAAGVLELCCESVRMLRGASEPVQASTLLWPFAGELREGG